MPTLRLPGRFGEVPVWVAEPDGEGPWPGVVVLHDANGMSRDLRNQARWLADGGYLAAAPDIYRGGGKIRCMVRTIREVAAGEEGPAMDAIDTARGWLAGHERCTGRIGVIGFCMGGGFALMLAPTGRYAAASVNYGGLSDRVVAQLPRACPIVASYGGRDPTLREAAARLERLLTEHGVPHDVEEYPAAGHGFMNRHPEDDLPWLFVVLGRLSRTGYDEAATIDARRRILAFFGEHLA